MIQILGIVAAVALPLIACAVLLWARGRGRRKDWIQTYTGRAVRPLAMRPEDVDIRDIARALSMLCRYAGHVARFYSVAEHSVRVARRVWELTGDISKTRKALLHDATEAYLVDVPAPVKRALRFWFYRRAERKAAAVISLALDLLPYEPAEVHAADMEVLGTEARQLKSPVHPDWRLPAELPIGPLGWSPTEAETAFLWTYSVLHSREEARRGTRSSLERIARDFP